MQSESWISLLQKVPPTYQHHLALITSVGMEVSIQEVLRAEAQYLVLRGRQSGTNDTGRIFFIPYDQINLLCVQKPMGTPEICAMYGEPPGDTADEAPVIDAPAAVEETRSEKESAAPSPPPPPAMVEHSSKTPTRPRLSKSELLARIRSRNQGVGANPLADQ